MSNIKNIYQKVAEVKKELRKVKFTKTGKNPFANFDYFNLEDFNPTLQRLLCENGLHERISFKQEFAVLTIVNMSKAEETDSISLPMPPFERLIEEIKTKDKKSNINQKIGSTATYMKRYLLQLYFDIDDRDTEDIKENKKSEEPIKTAKSDIKKPVPPKENSNQLNPITWVKNELKLEKSREEIVSELTKMKKEKIIDGNFRVAAIKYMNDKGIKKKGAK